MKLDDFRALATVCMLVLLVLMVTSCSTSMEILAGADIACGNVHAEGYFTDTQGEIVIAKLPEGWTAQDAIDFCNNVGQ